MKGRPDFETFPRRVPGLATFVGSRSGSNQSRGFSNQSFRFAGSCQSIEIVEDFARNRLNQTRNLKTLNNTLSNIEPVSKFVSTERNLKSLLQPLKSPDCVKQFRTQLVDSDRTSSCETIRLSPGIKPSKRSVQPQRLKAGCQVQKPPERQSPEEFSIKSTPYKKE